MSAKTYSFFAAMFFTFLAIIQLLRATLRTEVLLGTHLVVPIATGWIVFALLTLIAVFGFRAASHN